MSHITNGFITEILINIRTGQSLLMFLCIRKFHVNPLFDQMSLDVVCTLSHVLYFSKYVLLYVVLCVVGVCSTRRAVARNVNILPDESLCKLIFGA